MNKLVVALSILSIVSCVVAQSDDDIRAALIDLYNSTQGPAHWIRQKYWATDAPICTWDNILCKGSTFQLNLNANDLIGTIPNSIGKLGTNITALALDRNRLNGTIPASLTNLTKLTQLDVSQNTLTGSIPYGFGALQYLELFWFNNNNLVGAIPVDLITVLPNVTKYQNNEGCRLIGNNFCCPVPEWVPPACGMTCNITQACTESISIQIN